MTSFSGSSSGIGRSTAVLLAKEGAKVTVTGRNPEKIRETVDEILKNGGKSEDVNIVIGDLTESECQAELVKSTLERFGKIDILVSRDFVKFFIEIIMNLKLEDTFCSGQQCWSCLR